MSHTPLIPLWQRERNPMIVFLISVNTEVCVSESASKAVMLRGHFCLTVHLSPPPHPREPTTVSPISQQYTATRLKECTTIIYRAKHAALPVSWPQRSIKHKSFISEITAPQ